MKIKARLTSALAILLVTSIAAAQSPSTLRPSTIPVSLKIETQSLEGGLNAFARQSGLQVIFRSEDALGLQSPPLDGAFAPEDALKRLLGESGLRYQFINARTIAIRASKTAGRDLPAKTSQEMAHANSLRLAQADSTNPAAGVEGATPTTETQKSSDDVSGTSEEDKAKSDEVVITGSRIAKVSSQLAANVIVLDAEALRATGENTLERALRQLPQNMLGAAEVGSGVILGGMSFNGALNITGGSTINLRGLGSESTLVLIDGRRIGKSGMYGGASDVSGIPLSSVERVEVMLDGASSVYGSDAVGGVVNIILKKNYHGSEATALVGVPEQGGFNEQTYTFSAGDTWGTTRVRGTLEYYKSTDLDGAERPERIYTNRWNIPAGVQCIPLCFYTYNGQNYLPSALAGLGLAPDSPGVEPVFYTQLPRGQDGTGLSLQDFEPLVTDLTTAQGFNQDIRAGMSLIPAKQSRTAQVGFDKDFALGSRQLTLSGNAYYSSRDTQTGLGTFWTTFYPDSTVPNNPFTEAFFSIVFWEIPQLGVQHYSADQKVSRFNLALDGDLPHGWRWTLAGAHSRDDVDSIFWNAQTGSLPPGFNYLASDLAAVNTPEQIQLLRDLAIQSGALNTESAAELSANGTVFHLPGGEAHLALGVEWREENLESFNHSNAIGEGGLTAGDFNASLPGGAYAAEVGRVQRAAFSEVLIPLVGAKNAMRGVRQLELTGSGRYDSYDVYGDSTTWSAGLIWSPAQDLRFKANHSTSFVVPTPREGLADVRVLDFTSDFLPLPGLPADVVDAAGIPTGELDYIGKLILGGNRNLDPETAASTSVGVQYVPHALTGLRFGATWHRTKYDNRITSAPDPVLLSGTDYVATYPNLTRENGVLVEDLRAINSAEVETTGIDYQLGYNRETAIGQFILTGNVAYTHDYHEVPFTGVPEINLVSPVDGVGTSLIIPRYRYSANLGWYRRGWSINVDGSTATDVTDRFVRGIVPVRRTSSAPLMLDLLLGYDTQEAALSATLPTWLQGTAVSLRVLNVLDDQPTLKVIDERTNAPLNAEYNANFADPRGRMFTLSVTKRF